MFEERSLAHSPGLNQKPLLDFHQGPLLLGVQEVEAIISPCSMFGTQCSAKTGGRARHLQKRAPLPFRTSFPVARRPHPARARGFPIPMTRHPDGVHAGACFPMARHPNPMRVYPRPITRYPHLVPVPRRSSCIHFWRRRCFRHHHRRRCRHRLRRSHLASTRATCTSACQQTRRQRQNSKSYSLHNILSPADSTSRCRSPSSIYAARRIGQVGNIATRRGGGFSCAFRP